MVLDEVQRRAKRSLIEQNRSKRQVQIRQQRIRRALIPNAGNKEAEKRENAAHAFGSECARKFWAIFADFEHKMFGKGRKVNKGAKDEMEKNGGTDDDSENGTAIWVCLRILHFAQSMLAPDQIVSLMRACSKFIYLLIFMC